MRVSEATSLPNRTLRGLIATLPCVLLLLGVMMVPCDGGGDECSESGTLSTEHGEAFFNFLINK